MNKFTFSSIKSLLENIRPLPNDECSLTEEKLFEMARVQPKNSGIPQLIFVSTRDYGTGVHWARIKVSNIPGTFSKTDNFSVSIEPFHPKIVAGKTKFKQAELNGIFDWVTLNYDALIKYWNKEYDDDRDFFDDLHKI